MGDRSYIAVSEGVTSCNSLALCGCAPSNFAQTTGNVNFNGQISANGANFCSTAPTGSTVRVGLGILNSIPVNDNGAYVSWLNSGTGHAAGSLGLIARSSAAGKIVMYTGSGTPVERLMICSDGNVGIGTINPDSKLHVVGTVHVGDYNNAQNIDIEGDINFNILDNTIAKIKRTWSDSLNGGLILQYACAGTLYDGVCMDGSGNVTIKKRLIVNQTNYTPATCAHFESTSNCDAVRIYGWTGSTTNNVALRVINKGGTTNGGNCGISVDAYYTAGSSSGRSHGIWTIAGGKTSCYNYGIIGQLCGSNDGAGLVGITPDCGWTTTLPAGCWAGAFYGKTYHNGDINFGTGAARTICFNTTSSGVGSSLTILGNKGAATSAGGAVIIEGGAGGNTSGNGGTVTIKGGSTSGSCGGNVIIEGTDGEVAGGCVEINAGTTTSFLASPNSCTSLYYAGSAKLKTVNGGVEVTGTVCASSWMCATDFKLSSDCRLKTNIEPILISPINVEYKQFELISEPNRLRYGVIAQELQQINPELVSVGDDGYLSVSYTDLLIKEIASLKCRVAELERKLE